MAMAGTEGDDLEARKNLLRRRIEEKEKLIIQLDQKLFERVQSDTAYLRFQTDVSEREERKNSLSELTKLRELYARELKDLQKELATLEGNGFGITTVVPIFRKPSR